MRFSAHIYRKTFSTNPLNAELNPICRLLALLGGATIVVVSRLRVNRSERKFWDRICPSDSFVMTCLVTQLGQSPFPYDRLTCFLSHARWFLVRGIAVLL